LPNVSRDKRWGNTPWTIDFHPHSRSLPEEVDFAIIGGGFTGLSAAVWLRRLTPERSVALLEAETVGAGSSGHTGGMVLAESAAGDLPELGDVLTGFSNIMDELRIDCDLMLPGAWELGRKDPLPDSPIAWNDSGDLRVAREVPGGCIDAGKLVTGLARAAEGAGAVICEHARVENVVFGNTLRLEVAGKPLRAHRALFASNAESLEISGLAAKALPKFTLALATRSLTDGELAQIGLSARKPFYTIDFPYLWGRLLSNNSVVFGSGLVNVEDWRALAALDIGTGEAAQLISRLEQRVHGLHPALRAVEITHRWGGPILIGDGWTPIFSEHPQSSSALVLGAYSGHGVALSLYLGRWAAEALVGRRALPPWNAS
jgi:glycine/D-amino acid oxidase-like deaminating enzyme